jgi:uncharacterized protein YodC (DUF2158 family)
MGAFTFSVHPTCFGYARLSPRPADGAAAARLQLLRSRRVLAARTKLIIDDTEFNMSALTKQVSIAIAGALGIALSMAWAVPAFSDAAPSHAAAQSRPTPRFRTGDLVRVRSGGPLMTVTGVQGDQVNCSWTGWDGQLKSESFPIVVLGAPVTLPREDRGPARDQRATD